MQTYELAPLQKSPTYASKRRKAANYMLPHTSQLAGTVILKPARYPDGPDKKHAWHMEHNAYYALKQREYIAPPKVLAKPKDSRGRHHTYATPRQADEYVAYVPRHAAPKPPITQLATIEKVQPSRFRRLASKLGGMARRAFTYEDGTVQKREIVALLGASVMAICAATFAVNVIHGPEHAEQAHPKAVPAVQQQLGSNVLHSTGILPVETSVTPPAPIHAAPATSIQFHPGLRHITVAAGDTYWGQEQLAHPGASDSQVAEYTSQALAHDHLSSQQAAELQVGTVITVLYEP